MPTGFYKDLAKLLKAHGYRHDGNYKGSHEKWVNEEGKALTVPRSTKGRHTANGILKDAGIDKEL